MCSFLPYGTGICHYAFFSSFSPLFLCLFVVCCFVFVVVVVVIYVSIPFYKIYFSLTRICLCAFAYVLGLTVLRGRCLDDRQGFASTDAKHYVFCVSDTKNA